MRKDRNRGHGFEGLIAAQEAMIDAASFMVGLLFDEQESTDSEMGEVVLTDMLRDEAISWLKKYSPDAEWPGKKKDRA